MSDAPNKLVQVTPWRNLLCEKCEGRFSRAEGEIAEHIFVPLHEADERRFRYGPAFAKFAASVVWRLLVVGQRETQLANPGVTDEALNAAERAWREFLLDERRSTAPHELHAVPLSIPTEGDPTGLPPNFHRFLLRSVVHSITSKEGEGSCYVVAKMARLLIVGAVAAGSERNVWKETKIHAGGGAWGNRACGVPTWLGGHLLSIAERAQFDLDNLSRRQKQRTERVLMEAATTDPLGFLTADSTRAYREDRRIFGKRADQKPPPDEQD